MSIPSKKTLTCTFWAVLGCCSEEEDGNAATDEPAAAIAAAEDAPLEGATESPAIAAAVAGVGAKPAASGRACKLCDVLARVATAEACIAQHASQEAPVRPLPCFLSAWKKPSTNRAL